MSAKHRRDRKTPWLAANSGKSMYCRTCAKQKSASEFWDNKTRKPVKTCRSCLGNRRVNAKVAKGKTPHYFAYIQSKAWARKRAWYW